MERVPGYNKNGTELQTLEKKTSIENTKQHTYKTKKVRENNGLAYRETKWRSSVR
jgi:hypothetical protein